MVVKTHQIAVIGAGLIGHGIALTLARAGQSVAITDPVEAARESVTARIGDSMKAMGLGDGEIAEALTRVEVVASTQKAVENADMVFEAAPEKMALKRAIFAEVEAHAPETCIFASSTSVMPITQIMQDLRLKNRALGTH